MLSLYLQAERARTEEQLQQVNAQLHQQTTEVQQARAELQQKEAQIHQEQAARALLQDDKRQLTAELNSAQQSLQVSYLQVKCNLLLC